jgi:glycosyltransferase involved in cell wall biosynthesis
MKAAALRILCVTGYYKPAYWYGGPVGSTSALYEALAREGASITVLTTDANGPQRLKVPLGQPVPVDGVKVWYYPLVSRMLGFYDVPQQNAAVRRMAPGFDLILADAFWSAANLAAGRAARKVNLPYVIPLHGQLNDWAFKHRAWKKRIFLMLGGKQLLKRAAAIHCTDPVEVQSLEKFGLGSRASVFLHGVDLRRYQDLPAQGRLRAQFGIPSPASLCLFLGRLSKIKRPDLAVQALAAARAANQDVYLVIAGPDEDRLAPSLSDLSRDLGCADRVHLAGLLSPAEVLAALADANLLLMPSEEQENFGLSAAEALAAGVPVLTSPFVPVGQWAAKARAGRLAECDPQAFGQAACEMLADPQRLKAMGERGRELACQKFDISVIARQTLAHFQSLVENGTPLS